MGCLSAKPTPKTRRRATSVINLTAMDVAGIYERSLRHWTCISASHYQTEHLLQDSKPFRGQPKRQKLRIRDDFFFGSKWWIECWQIHLTVCCSAHKPAHCMSTAKPKSSVSLILLPCISILWILKDLKCEKKFRDNHKCKCWIQRRTPKMRG
jgi:hypothetical protein